MYKQSFKTAKILCVTSGKKKKKFSLYIEEVKYFKITVAAVN